MGRITDTNDVPNTEIVINVSGERAKFELDGQRYQLDPKETLQVKKAYALPRSMAPGRDPVASTVDQLTGGRVLSVKDKRARAVAAAAGVK